MNSKQSPKPDNANNSPLKSTSFPTISMMQLSGSSSGIGKPNHLPNTQFK